MAKVARSLAASLARVDAADFELFAVSVKLKLVVAWSGMAVAVAEDEKDMKRGVVDFELLVEARARAETTPRINMESKARSTVVAEVERFGFSWLLILFFLLIG